MARKAAVLSGEQKTKPEYAQVIAELRKQCRVTQLALALELDVTPTTVARWEGGSREPDHWGYYKLWGFASRKNKHGLATYFRRKLPERFPPTVDDTVKTFLEAERGESLSSNLKPTPPTHEARETSRATGQSETSLADQLRNLIGNAQAGNREAQAEIGRLSAEFGIAISGSSMPSLDAKGASMDDQDLADIRKRIESGLRKLAKEKQGGNRAAAESLRSIVETIVRIAGIATDPTLPRARRALLMREALVELSKIDHL
jgi:transcriptional regulator with XRE-family HTH domain